MRRIVSNIIERAAIGFALASLGMPFVAAMVWISEVVNAGDFDDKGMRIFLAFRVCGAFCALLALTIGGLLEIFVHGSLCALAAKTGAGPNLTPQSS
jgi:hypothetical protein